ncbi:unnamed protein product [Spodoptera exigua]|nr:unnamed protein product [Spodoptera exigua]
MSVLDCNQITIQSAFKCLLYMPLKICREVIDAPDLYNENLYMCGRAMLRHRNHSELEYHGLTENRRETTTLCFAVWLSLPETQPFPFPNFQSLLRCQPQLRGYVSATGYVLRATTTNTLYFLEGWARIEYDHFQPQLRVYRKQTSHAVQRTVTASAALQRRLVMRSSFIRS